MFNKESIIRAITIDDDIAKISILEVPDQPGIAFRLFQAIAKENIRVESIVQNINRQKVNDITFTVSQDQVKEAFELSNEYANEVGAQKVVLDKGVARLSVIGSGMVANANVAAKFFKALYDIGVNIQTISTSEVKFSCVIDKSMATKALKQLYKEFEISE